MPSENLILLIIKLDISPAILIKLLALFRLLKPSLVLLTSKLSIVNASLVIFPII